MIQSENHPEPLGRGESSNTRCAFFFLRCFLFFPLPLIQLACVWTIEKVCVLLVGTLERLRGLPARCKRKAKSGQEEK